MKKALTLCGMVLAAAVTTPAMAMPPYAPMSLLPSASAQAVNGLSNATILIVRHAEKPDSGRGLSNAGDMRALAYASYFSNLDLSGAPVHIASLVAAIDTKSSARSRLTLEPLSEKMGMLISQPCAEKQVHKLVSWLRDQPGHVGATLIAWHHTKIAKLLAAFGEDPAAVLPGGHWPNDVFDRVIVLHFNAAGKLIPSDTKVVQEPNSVNNVVWKAMAHPTVRPFLPFLQQAEAAGGGAGDEQIAER